MADRLDIIIFGATGFTGKVAVEEIVALAKEKGNLTWGIAGRTQSKLQEALDSAAKKTGKLIFLLHPFGLSLNYYI